MIMLLIWCWLEYTYAQNAVRRLASYPRPFSGQSYRTPISDFPPFTQSRSSVQKGEGGGGIFSGAYSMGLRNAVSNKKDGHKMLSQQVTNILHAKHSQAQGDERLEI